MSTVGYGDMTPITPFGRFFTGLVSFLGIGIIAIPAGIISSGMTEVMRERKAARLTKRKERESEEKRKCPHCGKPMDDG
jgi:voltage-gated potassium channel